MSYSYHDVDTDDLQPILKDSNGRDLLVIEISILSLETKKCPNLSIEVLHGSHVAWQKQQILFSYGNKCSF